MLGPFGATELFLFASVSWTARMGSAAFSPEGTKGLVGDTHQAAEAAWAVAQTTTGPLAVPEAIL